MTIKLDLRPENLKRESRKAVNAIRLVAAIPFFVGVEHRKNSLIGDYSKAGKVGLFG